MDELVHQVRVACHDDHQIVTVVLHGLQDGVDGLLTEVVVGASVEGVGLIDEQYAAHGFFQHLGGFQCRLTHVACHKTAAVHLHQLALTQNAQREIDAAHQPCHHGLAGTGVAGEDHVEGQLGGGQVVLAAELVDLHHVDEAANLVLDDIKADVAVQLCKEVFQLFGGRQFFFLFPFGGFRLGLLLLGRGRFLFRLGIAPEVAVHAAQSVLRHGADDIQLLQDDLVFFIHRVSPLRTG